jgi:signal transduction histidine kinase/ActR/RegA family two-component response regulator
MKQLRLPREEVLGRHFSMFYPQEAVDRGWPQEELRLAKARGRFEDEGWRVRKDGTRFWANVVITALYDPTGELTGFAKITRDLTERRRTRRRCAPARNGSGCWSTACATTRSSCSTRTASCRAGTPAPRPSRATAPTRSSAATSAPSTRRRTCRPASRRPNWPRPARAHGRVEDEGWRVRKDGTLFWANVVITAVHGADGELRGFAKVTRDMSERRRLEELEQSSRRMNEFLAMLAHELRNPLAPIRNAVTIMQLETLQSPVLRNCRDVIDRQLTHVTRLVDDLLDVGRLMSNKVELRLGRVDLAEVMARAIEAARPFTDAHEQRVVQHMPDEPVIVRGDMTRLVQVLQNLLHNAAKFSPVSSTIDVVARIDYHMAVLEVRDAGCGIPVRSLDKIFELFAQEKEGQNAGEGGLGIGLTLCKSLVEMHGGSIIASSEGAGCGSTFTLSLPLAAAPSEATGDEANAANTQVAPLRILLVDDNCDSADSLAMLLELKGHEVRIAYEGEQAVQVAPRFAPHLAVIDLAMPKMDGYATIAALRAMPELAHTLYAAMTGFGHSSDRERTRDAGFHAHLVKPVELELFDALLAEVEARRSGRDPG